jgi:hypothetical protein
MGYRISVAAGESITEGVLVNEQWKVASAKAHATPHDPTIGTLGCLSKLAAVIGMNLPELLSQTDTIIHGTSLATNVVETRSGAKMGTIATKGFRTRMMFQQIPESDRVERRVDMHDFRISTLEPLACNYPMTEIEERVTADGQVLIPLNEESVREAVRYLKRHHVESIAILLMFSPLYPKHEQRVAEIIEEDLPGVYVALSSVVLPVIGEFDRWSTTMISAYVAPTIADYVAKISGILEKQRFGGQLLFSQINGGLTTPDIIVEKPATLLLSGPAANSSLGRSMGMIQDFQNLLSIDMSGTSYDFGVLHDNAVMGYDGRLGIGFAAANEDFLGSDIEQFEAHSPFVVNEVKELEDWEGAGEYRGSPGMYLELTSHTARDAAAVLQTGNSDSSRFSPLCVMGSGSAPLSEITVYGSDGSKRQLRTIDQQPVFPGDRCITKCAGGEGWGDPLDRAVEKVQGDVINGYVSVERARKVYGVELNPSTLEVQTDATSKLRADLRANTT